MSDYRWYRIFAARAGEVMREDVRADGQFMAEQNGLALARTHFSLEEVPLDHVRLELDGFLAEEGDADV